MSSENKKRIVFMGTPDFACPGLTALIKENDFEVVAVFTQGDKAVGRKQEITMPPVKRLALEHGISVFQPEKIRTEVETITNLRPDLIVVIAYGKIIPQSILDIPTYGCINVHASLLPKYRGAACLNAPILNGDNETGVTIMKMEAGLDTGPIIKQVEMELKGEETLSDVHDHLSNLGAGVLVETLKSWMKGELEAIKQNDDEATYISTLKKEDGKIEFTKKAEDIERMIRGLNPWPGTYCMYKNATLKILKSKILENSDKKAKIGEVYLDEGYLAVQCGQNSLLILELQLPGKKAMNIKEFLNGNKDIIGKILE